jgi:16S rRNA processing protein RimM
LSSSTERVVVGRLGRPHGLGGFLTIEPETDNPHRFDPGSALLTDSGETLIVRSQRRDGNRLLIAFSGVADRSAAERLRGLILTIAADARRLLTDAEYWPDQLEGLEVRDFEGRPIGRVTEVIQAPAQDRLVIIGVDGVEAEVPLVKELVPTVDVEAGYLVVAPIPGLLEG